MSEPCASDPGSLRCLLCHLQPGRHTATRTRPHAHGYTHTQPHVHAATQPHGHMATCHTQPHGHTHARPHSHTHMQPHGHMATWPHCPLTLAPPSCSCGPGAGTWPERGSATWAEPPSPLWKTPWGLPRHLRGDRVWTTTPVGWVPSPHLHTTNQRPTEPVFAK